MATINPYLNYPGNSEEAFNFYRSVFGGEFSSLVRFKDMPGINAPAADGEKLMHVALPIGKGNVLMATDALESMGHKYIPGNNFSVQVEAQSKDEAKKIFDGLSSGAKITQPISDAPWGAYFGALKDRYGVQWMVNHTYGSRN